MAKSAATALRTDGDSLTILFNPDIYSKDTLFDEVMFPVIHEVVEAGFVTNLPGEEKCRELFDRLQKGMAECQQPPTVLTRLSDYNHFKGTWAEFVAAGQLGGVLAICEVLETRRELVRKLDPQLEQLGLDRRTQPDRFLTELISQEVLSLF